MAILYLISVITLWIGIVLCRKSDKKLNLIVWGFCSAMFVLCIQVMCAGIIGKLGLSINCGSIGIANLMVSLVLALWIAKKGVQTYEIKALDIVSLVMILSMTLVYALFKYGWKFDQLNFIGVDASAHCRFAREVALEHGFSTNLYFSSLTTGMLMQVQLKLIGSGTFDLYRSFLIAETIYTMLAAGLFWALLRERCGDGKWQRFVPLVLTPFYWAGYPIYSTLIGFSYLGVATSLINLELILLNWLCEEKIYRFISVIGLNVVLYGVFVSYTMFVPTAFVGAFIVIVIQMVKEADGKIQRVLKWKNLCRMLVVFLLPSVLGMIYSFGNLNELSSEGYITLEGGGYRDIYSNFILPMPFVIIGLFCLIKRKDGHFIIPLLAVHVVFMAFLLIGLSQNRVSVYYYVKNNNVLWLLVWGVVAEAIWGMMRQSKLAALLPLYFYVVLGCGMIVDPWLNKIKEIPPKVQSSVDLFVTNSTYFFHGADTNYEKVALFRYADEHFDLKEVISVNYELENGWFSTLTEGRNTYIYGKYEDFLKLVEEKKIRYIIAEHCEMYSVLEPYFDTLEVITENSMGKIFKIPEELGSKVGAPALM